MVSSLSPNHLPAASLCLLPGTYPTPIPEEVFLGIHQNSVQTWATLHACGQGASEPFQSTTRLVQPLLESLFKFSSASKYIRKVKREVNIESP